METVVLRFKPRQLIANKDVTLTGVKLYTFYAQINNLPDSLPNDANVREAATSGVQKDVAAALLDPQNKNFHNCHLGLYIVAQSVQYIPNREELLVVLEKGKHGLYNGGSSANTFSILKNQISNNKFVRVEVRTGLSDDMLIEMTAATNSVNKVAERAIDNKLGVFDEVKEVLKNTPYFDLIAFSQNETNKLIRIEDLIRYMYIFNPRAWPQDADGANKEAYRSRNTIYKQFVSNPDLYEGIYTILPQILELSDNMHLFCREGHNNNGGRAGGLSLFREKDKENKVKLAFLTDGIKVVETTGLVVGAHLPILSGLSRLVKVNKNGFKWSGSYEVVSKAAKDLAPKFVDELYKLGIKDSREMALMPAAWITCQNIVDKWAMRNLER